MASRLDRPLTDSKGNFIDYEGRRRRSSASDSGSGNHGHRRHSGTSLDSTQHVGMPEPEHYYGRAPSEDGGMQNLMEPPDDNAVYPRAAPVGPDAGENLGRHSQTVECPWCHAVVTTRIKRRIGFKSGGAAVLVAVIAWPLFWVPLLVPGLHRKTHYCPQCRRKIGRGRRHA
ncbi:hypothetical protein IWW55_005569 [Coemansia sp. RSA 2706]|nr:hypothetical protein LPJ63_001455 [Coemansia sp. RSA 2711]KAJ1850016.1 hypothetical protein LPJ70_000093 [Coemansia sp. RSA 2708]KAJ2295068.1 hypothetical protein IWW55_005569 [Coemansia sp. RSA 2706]